MKKAPSLKIQNPHAKSDERLGELMLFIAQKCANHSAFGAVKLNKILFFADCKSFVERGHSITGAAHMRVDMGPVPKRLLPVRKQLCDQGRAALQKVPLPLNREQHRLVALDNPRLDKFTADDIVFVDWAIDSLKGHNAEEVSEFSHDQLPAWHIAEDKEEIPLEAAFIRSLKPKFVDKSLALELAEKHGW